MVGQVNFPIFDADEILDPTDVQVQAEPHLNNIPTSVNILKSVGKVNKSVNNAEHKVESVHRSRLEPDHTNRIKQDKKGTQSNLKGGRDQVLTGD